MAEYTLHCFAQSGNAYKVALALELAGADWEPAFVDFFKGAARTPEFADMNIMAEVPVLDHGAERLTQSGVILDYLAGKLGRFGPSAPHEANQREIWRWILWDNHKLTANLAMWRFLVNFAPEKARNPDVIGFAGGRALAAMKVLDSHLYGRDWIVGDAMTTADLSCVGYMFYTDDYDFEWGQYPNVVAWRDRIAALPGWKHPHDLMPGYPLP